MFERMRYVASQHKCAVLEAGGVADHVHLLVSMHASISLSELVQHMKGNASHWLHKTHPNYQHIYWRDGYGAFSVSNGHMDTVGRYIRNQSAHHRAMSVENELELLHRGAEMELDDTG